MQSETLKALRSAYTGAVARGESLETLLAIARVAGLDEQAVKAEFARRADHPAICGTPKAATDVIRS
jgi:hypothetical protein